MRRAAVARRLCGAIGTWLEALPGFSEEMQEYIDRPLSCWEGVWVVVCILGVPVLFTSICWIPCGDVASTPLVIESAVLLVVIAAMSAFLPAFMSTFSGPGCYHRHAESVLPLVMSCTYVAFFCLIPQHAFGVFPVPMAGITFSVVMPLLALPLLLLSSSPEAREDPQKRRAILTSLEVLLLSIVLLAVAVPLSLLVHSHLHGHGPAQALLLALPYVLRKVFDLVCFRLLRHVRPDLYPFCRLLSMGMYDGFLTVLMMNAANFQWYAVPLVVASDLLENVFYLIVASQAVASPDTADAATRWVSAMVAYSDAQADGGSDGSSSPHASSAGEGCKTRFLLAFVLVKEAVEALVPLQIMVSFVGIYFFNPKWNHITAGMSPEHFRFGCWVSAVDILLEVLMLLMLLRAVKQWCGLNPGKLLLQVLRHDLKTHMLTLTTILMYTIMLQNVAAGTDYTFRFNWLKGNSTWHGGFCWTVGDEAPRDLCGPDWHERNR